MSFRCLCLIVFLAISPFWGDNTNLLYAQDGATSTRAAETSPSWWTPDRARYISLALLLSVGGSLIWVSILRRRIQSQLETIQFYEDEVSLLRKEKEAALSAKSYLFNSISNEFKTPLDDIQAFSVLLKETMYDERQLECTTAIETQAATLQLLVKDLQDISKIEAGALKLEPIPFILQQCLKDAIHLVLPRATEKELELSYSIESGVPRALQADGNHLNQVLTHLLNNGIKFTERGSVSIHVSSKKRATAHEVTFAVKDTGIGIHEDKLALISESLQQTQSLNPSYQEGIGLGLLLCQRLITLMNGRIWVESTVGEGSTFFFAIHAQEAHVEEHQPPPASPPSETAIALVDPNRITRKIAMKFFERLGHTVDQFSSIESMIPYISSTPYNLIFLDINEVEAPNLMPALMDLKVAAENIPITIITESNTGENEAALKALGMTHIIRKPIQLKDLEEIIQINQSAVQS